MSRPLELADLDFNPDGTIYDDHGTTVPAGVAVLYKNMLMALNKAYPKFEGSWHITIDTRGGIVQVRNLALHGDMGFVLHIEKIDPEMRRIRTMAGELFERFNVARSRGMAIKRALADVKRDGIGRGKYEE